MSNSIHFAVGMPTIIIFTLPLTSTPTCIKAPHYCMTLPHDFVDLKLGLQLALQLDWPCLKKSICLTVLKIELFLGFYLAKSFYLHRPVMPCLVPGQAHWKHVLHTNWWWRLVVFKLSYLCSPTLGEMIWTCSFFSEKCLFVSLVWNWFYDWGSKKLSLSSIVLAVYGRL